MLKTFFLFLNFSKNTFQQNTAWRAIAIAVQYTEHSSRAELESNKMLRPRTLQSQVLLLVLRLLGLLVHAHKDTTREE